eukprot:PITA_16571
MNEEYHSLLANDTWDLVPLPKGRKLVRCKWVYRTKYGPDGKVDKHKARLVAKGFSQVEGIDYTETFSPVAKMNSVRLVLSLAASFNGKSIRWILNPPSCMGICMKKSIWNNLLGLYKQTPVLYVGLRNPFMVSSKLLGAWYAKMDSFLLESGFSRCHSDNTIYTKKEGKSLIILVLYVDDLILTHSDSNLINHVKSILKKKFEMTDLGHLHYFLGLQVLQSKEGIFLSQSRYACDLLRLFHMEDSSPLLVGFTDSDWAGDPDDRKSTTSYVFTLGSGPITWDCKKRATISLSSVEAEYRGAVEASKEALWLRQILSEFGFQQQHPTTLWCDNQSAIHLCKYPVQHQRNKLIELHMHFIRKLIRDLVLEVQYCSTDDQVADIFTKALTEAKFTKLRFMVGVQEVVTKGG